MLRKDIEINANILHFCFIDFGFSMKYGDTNGIHYEADQMKNCGNYYYASINALETNTVSRKDDIISIIYMLLVWCLGYAPACRNLHGLP